jgi:hypothetical protein
MSSKRHCIPLDHPRRAAQRSSRDSTPSKQRRAMHYHQQQIRNTRKEEGNERGGSGESG